MGNIAECRILVGTPEGRDNLRYPDVDKKIISGSKM
jgi:hypothetical protein